MSEMSRGVSSGKGHKYLGLFFGVFSKCFFLCLQALISFGSLIASVFLLSFPLSLSFCRWFHVTGLQDCSLIVFSEGGIARTCAIKILALPKLALFLSLSLYLSLSFCWSGHVFSPLWSIVSKVPSLKYCAFWGCSLYIFLCLCPWLILCHCHFVGQGVSPHHSDWLSEKEHYTQLVQQLRTGVAYNF